MKIAILGASKPHLTLYLKAKEMGLETYCIAWNKGAYCRDYADHYFDISILEKERIADFCMREGISAIISNAIEEAVPTMAYVSERCGFIGNSYKVAQLATNKLEMRKCIAKISLCYQPRFNVVHSLDFQSEYFPIIVKPTDGSCSKGVSKVNSQSELASAIRHALHYSSKKEVLVEQFIEGKEVSVETISYKGKHYILTITDKETTGSPYFVELAHHQPSQLKIDIQKKIRENATRVLNSLGIQNGASHIEFKVDINQNVYFIELGARGGGDFISYNLVELSTGYDYVKGMIQVAIGQFEEPSVREVCYSGIYFLCQETEGLLKFVHNNDTPYWMIEKHIDNNKLVSAEKSQDRSGYFIYKDTHKISLRK